MHSDDSRGFWSRSSRSLQEARSLSRRLPDLEQQRMAVSNDLAQDTNSKKVSTEAPESSQPTSKTSDTGTSSSEDNAGNDNLDIIPEIPEGQRLNLKYEAVSCWVPNNTGSVSLFEGLKPNMGMFRKKKDAAEDTSNRQVHVTWLSICSVIQKVDRLLEFSVIFDVLDQANNQSAATPMVPSPNNVLSVSGLENGLHLLLPGLGTCVSAGVLCFCTHSSQFWRAHCLELWKTCTNVLHCDSCND